MICIADSWIHKTCLNIDRYLEEKKWTNQTKSLISNEPLMHRTSEGQVFMIYYNYYTCIEEKQKVRKLAIEIEFANERKIEQFIFSTYILCLVNGL